MLSIVSNRFPIPGANKVHGLCTWPLFPGGHFFIAVAELQSLAVRIPALKNRKPFPGEVARQKRSSNVGFYIPLPKDGPRKLKELRYWNLFRRFGHLSSCFTGRIALPTFGRVAISEGNIFPIIMVTVLLKANKIHFLSIIFKLARFLRSPESY